MIYGKNKSGFKKTTSKVENVDARKNIVNLVKERIGQKIQTSEIPKQNVRNSNNKQNVPKTNTKVKQFNRVPRYNEQFQKQNIQFSNLVPKICESIQGSPKDQSQVDHRICSLEHTKAYQIRIDLSTDVYKPLKSQLNPAQEQYISLLEQKLNKSQIQSSNYLKELTEYKNKYNEYLKRQQRKQIYKQNLLTDFYHDARNVIINAAAELMQCRQAIDKCNNSQQSRKDEKSRKQQENQLKQRIKSINVILGKCQHALDIHRKLRQQQNIIQQSEIMIEVNMKKLQKTCRYQQKTIQFLRKQSDVKCQINQVKLLRHQINRLSNLNQKMAEKYKTLQNHQPKTFACPQKLKQENIRLTDLLHVLQINNQTQQAEIISLQKKLTDQKDACYKYKQEKQVLIEFLEQQKDRCSAYEKKIQFLQMQLKKQIQQQYKYKEQNKLKLEKQCTCVEELLKTLKPYPKYFNLLKKTITQYEYKISRLQETICEQKQIKQKFKQWSSSVYKLLLNHNVDHFNKQDLQKQLQQLYRVDQSYDKQNIQKFLRQIKALSIGIDERQIQTMQQQLQQYVITLKNRNQTIKQVQYEDGSSVAYSDTFTEQQFQQDL